MDLFILGYILRRRLLLFFFLFSLSIFSKADNIDSLYIKKYNKVIYYDSEDIFSNYADKGFLYVIDDLYEYYEDVFQYLPLEKKNYEVEKMRRMAQQSNSKELDKEADLMHVLSMPEGNDTEVSNKAEELQKIVNKSEQEKDTSMLLRSMESIFDLYWRTTNYSKAFKQVYEIEKKIQNITDEQYPLIRDIYCRIGEAYLSFQDYNKAIPYLRRAMVPSKFYIDRSNLKAINAIGIYHNLKGEIDSSDYYFRLAYNSHDRVKARTTYDAMALSNLGHNLIKKGAYNDAIPYFRSGFTYMLDKNDYKPVSDVSVGLAQCYFARGDMHRAKQLIDSSLLYIRKSENNSLYKSLYPLMCKYYIKTGNKILADAFLDSTIAFNEKYLNKYNSIHLLRAEQELFDTETLAKNEELRYQKEKYNDRLFYSMVIIFCISLVLLIFAILYRKNRNAYRALVLKNQDWAGANVSTLFEDENDVEEESNDEAEPDQIIEKVVSEPNSEDVILMQEVNELMKKEKIFKELDLTLDSLSKQMNINRNYLSKAINKTTGKNFNTFINEYRIKEAVKIMSDKKSDVISIDAIALEVGFGNRISFYQSFKKITGLTPSDFRNNKVDNN